jgi:anti-anti-sigma factor
MSSAQALHLGPMHKDPRRKRRHINDMNGKTAVLAVRRAIHAADTISVGRSLDSSVARRLTRSVARLIEAGARRCTIDLSAVESADSSGFGALVTALRKLEEGGVHAVVVCADSRIQKLCELAEVGRLAPVVKRTEEARRLHALVASGLAS